MGKLLYSVLYYGLLHLIDACDLVVLICRRVSISTESNRTVPKKGSFIWTVQLASWIMKIFLEAVYSKMREDVD